MSTLYTPDGHKWRNYSLRLLVILTTAILIVLSMPRKSVPTYEAIPNTVWLKDRVVAEREFVVPKDSDVYKSEIEEALADFKPIYTLNPEIGNRYIMRFQSKYRDGIEGLPKSFVNSVTNKMKEIYEVGIISADEYAKLTQDSMATISLAKGVRSELVRCKTLYTPIKAYESFFDDPQMSYARSQLQKYNIDEYLKENVVLDQKKTDETRNACIVGIVAYSSKIEKGQLLVERGSMVTEEMAALLKAYSDELARNESLLSRSTTMIGRTLVIVLLLMIFTFYLHLFRGDYFRKPRALAMVYFFVGIFPILVSLVYQYSPHYVYILPLAMLPMFIRIFLDSRTAFVAHVTMVLISALALSEPMVFVVVQVTSGLISIYTLRELSKRSQVFTAAFTTSLVAIVTYQAMKLTEPGEDWLITTSEVSHFVFSGVLLLITYPLMYLVEKTFGFTSAVTLFELSDINKDLLRRLSEVASGTLQHSITVSNIAAAIAHKIGARSLLVRTGALYHDIGKISNPSFFTENQKDINPHDRMTPHESANIIINHVKEGKRLAEKYGLPSEIIDFIMTHHGAGMAKYFYITYKNEHPDEEVDKAPFTYPGPNPFTREQAILMMADAVEAASRSLKEYSDENITNLVNHVIDGIVSDGFFIDCPITFHDISISKRVIIERLKIIYHTRITYPELKEKKENAGS